jgi:hypothetical protein
MKPEADTVISGVGQSDVGRRLYRDPLELTLDACLAAIEDAGLTTKDIDGIATYPGPMSVPPGFSGAGVVDVQDALRLELGWWSGGIESPGRVPRGRRRARHARALLPQRLGGERPG